MSIYSYAERDFLPAAYLAQRRRRRSLKLSVLASLAILIAVILLSGYQYRTLLAIRAQAARLSAEFIRRTATAQSLEAVTRQLDEKEDRANWMARVSYQILASLTLFNLITLLPDEIVLDNIEWERIPPKERPPARQALNMTSQENGQEADQSALEQLRQDLEEAEIQITLHGRATNLGTIHQYVMVLSQSGRFGDVRLDSVENEDEQQGHDDNVFRISLRMQASPLATNNSSEKSSALPVATIPQTSLRHSPAE